MVLIAIERIGQQYSINNSLVSYSKTVKVNAVAKLGWRRHSLLKQVYAPKPKEPQIEWGYNGGDGSGRPVIGRERD